MLEHGHHGHGGEMTPEQQKQMIEQQLNLSRNLGQIKYRIAVMSGKGGVGKSTVAANIAEAFQKEGFTTGILDADIHGPNIPKMLGVEDQDIMINDERHMMPVEAPIKTLITLYSFSSSIFLTELTLGSSFSYAIKDKSASYLEISL